MAHDSLLLLLIWSLWKECNRCVFYGIRVYAAELVLHIAKEGNSWIGEGHNALSLFLATNS
jgi:hypothetical protein